MDANVDLMLELQEKWVKEYDSVINTVISDLLKRAPTKEELKDVQIYNLEEKDEMHYLTYCNKKLGIIYLDPQNFRFEPYENDEFLKDAVVNGKVTFKF